MIHARRSVLLKLCATRAFQMSPKILNILKFSFKFEIFALKINVIVLRF